MGEKKYFLYLLLSIILVFVIYGVLLSLGVLSAPARIVLIIVFVIVFQFMSAGVIVTAGKMDQPESFAQRFLILTTYQLFIIMLILLAVRFSAEEYFKLFLFHYMSIFMVLMIVQSVLLIKLGKKISG